MLFETAVPFREQVNVSLEKNRYTERRDELFPVAQRIQMPRNLGFSKISAATDATVVLNRSALCCLLVSQTWASFKGHLQSP